jgi:uncharacterized protein GlcG (DUF336 family)
MDSATKEKMDQLEKMVYQLADFVVEVFDKAVVYREGNTVVLQQMDMPAFYRIQLWASERKAAVTRAREEEELVSRAQELGFIIAKAPPPSNSLRATVQKVLTAEVRSDMDA